MVRAGALVHSAAAAETSDPIPVTDDMPIRRGSPPSVASKRRRREQLRRRTPCLACPGGVPSKMLRGSSELAGEAAERHGISEQRVEQGNAGTD